MQKDNNQFKYAIALTGGIATGKSTVASLFMLHGFLTIDADKIAHKLLDMHSDKIASMFGQEYVENGKVLRKELGKIIFTNEENKLKLESLLHPLIKDEIVKRSRLFESQDKPYFIDIPLFFDDEIVKVCNDLANRGVRVIVAGLDMDYQGKPFGPMPALMATAEYVTKVHAVCTRTGNLAHYSYRKSPNDKLVLLGEKENYEPLSRSAYFKAQQSNLDQKKKKS